MSTTSSSASSVSPSSSSSTRASNSITSILQHNNGNGHSNGNGNSSSDKSSDRASLSASKYGSNYLPIDKEIDDIIDDSSINDGCGGSCCDHVLNLYRLFHTLCVLSSIMTVISNGYIIFQYQSLQVDYRDTILRIYAIVFAILIAFIEVQWLYIIKKISILYKSWYARSFMFMFIGIITLPTHSLKPLYLLEIGLLEMALGIMYMLGEILLLKDYEKQRYLMHATIAI